MKMEDVAIVMSVVSFVTLVVFFVQAYNISQIKKYLQNQDERWKEKN